MPDLDLGPIKARVAVLTPAPWVYEMDELLPDQLSEIRWRIQAPKVARSVLGRQLPPSDEDGEFLAHARSDVPALVAEVEELRIDRERLQRLYHMAVDDGLPEGVADA